MTLGEKATQLKVTISSVIKNTFGAVDRRTNTRPSRRSGTADYQGPAPMGSPCNTFGNEPERRATGGASAHAQRVRRKAPRLAGQLHCGLRSCGPPSKVPETDKVSGRPLPDRGVRRRSSGRRLRQLSKNNNDYDDFGYVFVVKVDAAAVEHAGRPPALRPDVRQHRDDACEQPARTSSRSNTEQHQNTNVNTVREEQRRDQPLHARTAPTPRLIAPATATRSGDNGSGASREAPRHDDLVRAAAADRHAEPEGRARPERHRRQPLHQAVRRLQRRRQHHRPPTRFTSSSGSYNDEIAKTFHNWEHVVHLHAGTVG